MMDLTATVTYMKKSKAMVEQELGEWRGKMQAATDHVVELQGVRSILGIAIEKLEEYIEEEDGD